MRLKALHTACPHGKLELSWNLANSYGRELVRLTDWSSQRTGTDMFGNTIYRYSLPAFGLDTFSQSEMEAKKLELNVEARGLLPFLREYIADYEAAYKAVDTTKMSARERSAHSDLGYHRHESIETWEEAIKSLEEAPRWPLSNARSQTGQTEQISL